MSNKPKPFCIKCCDHGHNSNQCSKKAKKQKTNRFDILSVETSDEEEVPTKKFTPKKRSWADMCDSDED